MAAMIVRAYESRSGQKATGDGALNAQRFADAAQISGWAQAYVSAGVQLSLLHGRSELAFAPQDNATRAESAQVLLNLLQP
uniref:SLH domain-containing protein n=2 Tax=Paenibacillus athensensis TaxID=1967502 RepID=A0A4Y8PYG6_9BACL